MTHGVIDVPSDQVRIVPFEVTIEFRRAWRKHEERQVSLLGICLECDSELGDVTAWTQRPVDECIQTLRFMSPGFSVRGDLVASGSE